MNYKAKKNLVIGIGDKHHHVKVGEVFSCEEEYAEAHLLEHDHVEETDEPVAQEVKKEAKKASKEEKKKASKKD